MLPNPPAAVLQLLKTLREAGYPSWLAGGCVRDAILGRETQDWDIATPARPEVVLKLFRRTVPTGLQHGTVTVLLDGEEQAEVTTFRAEAGYIDGRHPGEVVFLDDINADLGRRDFTINSMAYDPIDDAWRDPFDGRGDLRRRLVRAVRDPHERFSEDGLRSLRAVRFASTLGFRIDPPTLTAIAATRATFRKVAAERVRDELQKLLLRSRRPSYGLHLLAVSGLLADTIPELLEGQGFSQNKWHRWTVWDHTMRVLDASAPRLVVRLAALLHDVAKPRCAAEVSPGEHTFYDHEFVGADVTTAILERLKFPRKVIDAVALQVREHNWHYTDAWTDGTVRRHLAAFPDAESIDDFFALRDADLHGRGRQVRAGLANIAELKRRFDIERARASALKISDLAIDGTTLMRELGLAPGRRVGDVLKALLQHVLDHPDANAPATLLALARSLPDPVPPAPGSP